MLEMNRPFALSPKISRHATCCLFLFITVSRLMAMNAKQTLTLSIKHQNVVDANNGLAKINVETPTHHVRRNLIDNKKSDNSKATKDKSKKETTDKNQVPKEKNERENGGKDQVAKEKNEKDNGVKNQDGKEKNEKEDGGKEKNEKENGGKEKNEKENGGKDQGGKEKNEKDNNGKDQGGKEKNEKDNGGKDQGGKEKNDNGNNIGKETVDFFTGGIGSGAGYSNEFGFRNAVVPTSKAVPTCAFEGSRCRFISCCADLECNFMNTCVKSAKTESPTAPPIDPSVASNEELNISVSTENYPSASPSTFTTAPAYASIESCRTLDPDSLYWCPVERYCLWGSYSDEVTTYLGQDLGYTQFQWNYLLPSSTDALSFSDHTYATRQGLKGLGYNEDKHDCCNSHYADYMWSDFFEYDGYNETADALITMGYNETSWNEGYAIEWDDLWWNELPQAIQYAAYDGFCLTAELWNEFPLQMWGDVEDLPGSYYFSELDSDYEYMDDGFDN